jgi:hypothetical protein
MMMMMITFGHDHHHEDQPLIRPRNRPRNQHPLRDPLEKKTSRGRVAEEEILNVQIVDANLIVHETLLLFFFKEKLKK